MHDKKGKGKKPSAGRGRKRASQSSEPSFFDTEEDPDPDEVPAAAEDDQAEPKPSRQVVQEAADRPPAIESLDTNEVMAACRQAARGRGWLDRDELLKDVSALLGYQRLGAKIEEALRGHLRAAIRRKIIEADGAQVRAATATMADYALDELREVIASVMRKGPRYEREDVIHAVAHYLGFARLTDTSRDALKSAVNSAIRQGILGYEGSAIWRET